MTRARAGPSPNTVCVPTIQSLQPLQPLEASRSLWSDGRGGMKSAAEPVTIACSIAISARIAFMRNARLCDDVFILVPTAHFALGARLFAVLLGLVVLLAVFVQAMMAHHGLTLRFRGAGGIGRVRCRVWRGLVELLHEPRVRLVAVAALDLLRGRRLALVTIAHDWGIS